MCDRSILYVCQIQAQQSANSSQFTLTYCLISFCLWNCLLGRISLSTFLLSIASTNSNADRHGSSFYWSCCTLAEHRSTNRGSTASLIAHQMRSTDTISGSISRTPTIHYVHRNLPLYSVPNEKSPWPHDFSNRL